MADANFDAGRRLWRGPVTMAIAAVVGWASAPPSVHADVYTARVVVKETPPIKPGDPPTNKWCTYDESKNSFGPQLVAFGGYHNRIRVYTCIQFTESVDTNGYYSIIGIDNTTSYFTDRWGQNTGLNMDVYVSQPFLSNSDYAQGREVQIFRASAGYYERECKEGRGPPVVYTGRGALPTHSKASILKQAATKGYIVYEEHGIDQC